jgi:GxxExxY protein
VPLTIENELAHKIIGFAIEIHKALGPGLKSEAYTRCLQYELDNAAIAYELSKSVTVMYKSLALEVGFDIDLLVENKVAVIIENSDSVAEYHVQKLLRLLKFSDIKLGLLINFNSTLLKDGIRRVTNNKLIEKELENEKAIPN